MFERGTHKEPRSFTFRQEIDTVPRVIAPAKVNLFLGIGSLRPDGYHGLVSVFHALALADEVAIEPSDRLTLECDAELDVPPEQNLAYRAAVAFGAQVGLEPAFTIRLTKRIPHGAGLGGGSSDAAAVIAGLAHLWGIDRQDARCELVAASLGADVPFFLTGGAALMSGRGDELSRELPAISGGSAVLVRPPTPVPTAEAYRAFDAAPLAPGEPSAVVMALEAGDVRLLAAALQNNMERASSAVVPEVAEALRWVRDEAGVLGAIVAGSGSAVFALCEDSVGAQATVRRAQERGWWSVATHLVAHGATVISEG